MRMFFPEKIEKFKNGVTVVFVTKRLAELIIKKSIQSKWLVDYFRIHNVYFGGYKSFRGVAINTRGLIIAIKL